MGTFVDHSRLPFRELFPTEFAADKELARHNYKIDYVRKTENAWLFFTKNTENNEHTVIKMLCNYKDSRYNLATSADRQRSQLEGLSWNTRFTKDVYIGLSRLCYIDRRTKLVGLADIIEMPVEEELDEFAEYVILMHELPKSRRLDNLLKESNQFAFQYHSHDMHLLARHIAYLHMKFASLAELPYPNQQSIRWGSPEQLKKKLNHNLAFVNQTLLAKQDDQHITYYKSLKKTYNNLKDDLIKLFEKSEYLEYFNRRLEGGYIRRCHGDLKGRNIWIYPYMSAAAEETEKCVKVLDAVDFNPMYSNIDILSDFAMLVVDVQARTKSCLLADSMIEQYLRCTQQGDKVSRAVLDFYLVEKAFIGGIVNIIYDELPTLGMSFLQVAEMRMQGLKKHRVKFAFSSE